MAELIMLRLDGILQSWGEDAKWDTRPTATMPTKSGIVGMIACAMGLERGNAAIKELAQKIAVGVRADRSGSILPEFQTVQGMPYIRTAEGKKRSVNTIVSKRQYLQDASFLVVIETNANLVREIEHAFAQPVWPVYLGRKSCIPSRPVWEGVFTQYEDIYDALAHYPTVARHDEVMQFEIESPMEDCGIYSRPDAIVGERVFAKRHVWHGTLRRARNVFD